MGLIKIDIFMGALLDAVQYSLYHFQVTHHEKANHRYHSTGRKSDPKDTAYCTRVTISDRVVLSADPTYQPEPIGSLSSEITY